MELRLAMEGFFVSIHLSGNPTFQELTHCCRAGRLAIMRFTDIYDAGTSP